jgi:hypothetical protein
MELTCFVCLDKFCFCFYDIIGISSRARFVASHTPTYVYELGWYS